jgi:hypothetical protein
MSGCVNVVVAVRTTRYGPAHVANLTGGFGLMAIHLTPTELAREAGMDRREVIEKCMELGVPIFQGRIDKTLFLANVSEQVGEVRQVATA